MKSCFLGIEIGRVILQYLRRLFYFCIKSPFPNAAEISYVFDLMSKINA